MERWQVQKAPDEELVGDRRNRRLWRGCYSGDDGMHLWKGKLSFQELWEACFFSNGQNEKKGVRVCLRSDAFKIDSESLSLSERVRKDEASAEEMKGYRQLQQARVKKILNADTESLFKIEEVIPDIPPKASIVESGICDLCGEPTKKDLLHNINGRRVCTPCALQQGFSNGPLSAS